MLKFEGGMCCMLWVLTSISTVFQLYRESKFSWCSSPMHP